MSTVEPLCKADSAKVGKADMRVALIEILDYPLDVVLAEIARLAGEAGRDHSVEEQVIPQAEQMTRLMYSRGYGSVSYRGCQGSAESAILIII